MFGQILKNDLLVPPMVHAKSLGLEITMKACLAESVAVSKCPGQQVSSKLDDPDRGES